MSIAGIAAAAFAAGLFGGAHCLGMCTPIVVLIEGPQRAATRWRYRLAVNAGRGAFYMLLGAVAGGFGLALTALPGFAPALGALRVAAAVLVLVIGLQLAFRRPAPGFLQAGGAFLWRRIAPWAARLLPVRTLSRAWLAGFAWGALPCGLVYGAVALAATTTSAPTGALIMAAFWLGTLPALATTGAVTSQLSRLRTHPAGRRLAGFAMTGAGATALAFPYLAM